MARITFQLSDGSVHIAEGRGGSLMELARNAGVRGIAGECGGGCSCGTCHVHLPDDWIDRLGRATPSEMDMLEFEPTMTRNSRLSCQIAVTDALDGLSVSVATG